MMRTALFTSFSRVFTSRLYWTLPTSSKGSSHFSGYIPVDGIKKSFSLSGGPGGQHVNKVLTKAEIRFDITTADWISPDLKEHVLKNFRHKITKNNELVIESSKTRSQSLNLADCFDKLRSMLLECAQDLETRQRGPSEQDVAILNKRSEEAAQRRLKEKKRQSDKKRERSAIHLGKMASDSTDEKTGGEHGHHGHSHSPCSISRGTKLIIMISMTFFFFIVEMVFGYISKSMALVADSFHMLSDVMALVIGLVCLKIAERNTNKNTFGWVRAEVLGALVNGVFLLALCFSILVESISRLLEPHALEDPMKVLVVGVIGLLINVIGLAMFHGHAHSHGPDPSSVQSELENNLRRKTPSMCAETGESRSLIVAQDKALAELKQDFEAVEDTLITGPKKVKPKNDGDGHLNMRGVFLHVLSDAIGSVIVIITAAIAEYAPNESGWLLAKQYMDPCLSIVMVILMMFTTLPLVHETALILLQTTPKFVNIEELQNQLLKIDGIVAVHEFHVWRLVGERIIATVHIRFISLRHYLSAAESIRTLFHDSSIHSATIQPEFNEMVETTGSANTECAFACLPSNCNVPDVSCCLINDYSVIGDDQRFLVKYCGSA